MRGGLCEGMNNLLKWSKTSQMLKASKNALGLSAITFPGPGR